MCFNSSLIEGPKEVAKRFNKTIDYSQIRMPESIFHINGFTFPEGPIITNEPEVKFAKWGLIPFWVKDEEQAKQIRAMTLNARDDSIFIKPSFREPIKHHRCLVPSTGYFEWHHEGKDRIPYFIHLKSEEIFSFAGIYDEWLDKETGELIKTYSIITTVANKMIGYIHNINNRMPVILHHSDENKWLDPDLNEYDIKAMFKPYPENDMDAYIIKRDFIKKNPLDESILDRAV